MSGPTLRPPSIVCMRAACAAYPGVLNRVLAAQKLDCHDVEGVKVLLDSLHREHCSADTQISSPQFSPVSCSGNETATVEQCGSRSSSKEQDEALSRLLQMDRAEAHRVLRDYLTAATAKDMSMMFTLRRCCKLVPSPEQNPWSWTAKLEEPVKGSDVSGGFQSKFALVDLDMKPLRKVYEHWRLDRDILNIAATMRENGMKREGLL